jgi:hypothetical protein
MRRSQATNSASRYFRSTYATKERAAQLLGNLVTDGEESPDDAVNSRAPFAGIEEDRVTGHRGADVLCHL